MQINRTNIFNKIRAIIIREFRKDKRLISMGSSLKNDLAFDSVDQIVLAMELEESFKIQISDEESETLTTIAEIIVVVEKKLRSEDKHI